MKQVFAQLEAAYEGNLGFEEMFAFYRSAPPRLIDRMERLLRDGKFKAAWELLKQFTKAPLRGGP